MRCLPAYIALAALVTLLRAITAQDSPTGNSQLQFQLAFAESELAQPFTGRVFVILTGNGPKPIVRDLDWFNPQSTLALDVTDWKPGTSITLGDNVRQFPPATPGRRYYAQAILDRDLGGRSSFSSPGNLYSKPKLIEFDPAKSEVVKLVLDQTYQPPTFAEKDFVKLVDIPSRLLSDFHARPTRLRAVVVLPPSFTKEPNRKYPVVYRIDGFSGDHYAALSRAQRELTDLAGTEVIWVMLDPSCRLGHHVFADSANNGPCGAALVQELIPHIESTFRGSGNPAARLVTGHSSGGWSSLWLQVTYPDTFGGCWSTSPDPVDFRDFQRVNLYAAGANLFEDGSGNPREMSRPSGLRKALTFRGFSAMEEVIGHGGQLGSFEAVFSPRGPDSKPCKLWDRQSGAIDPAVAKAWEKYDIRLMLENNWPAIGPKLSGKLHVWMGDEDTYYLEGATRLLKESLTKLGSDAVIEIFPGKSHALVDGTLQKRMREEMAATLAGGQ